MNWTARDEQRMSQLEKELQELQARRLEAQKPLKEMVREMCHEMDCTHRETDFAAWLYRHADRVRDALAPFDTRRVPDPEPVSVVPADCRNARAQQGGPYPRTCPRCGIGKSCPYGVEMPAPVVPQPQL